jgi:hypothetical protein
LRDASVDLALFSQSLRYATDPERALTEAVRVVADDGRVLILELKDHDQAWVRARFGEQRLGFSPTELDALLHSAGLSDVRISTGARKSGDPFTVLIASAVKSSDLRPARTPQAPRAW